MISNIWSKFELSDRSIFVCGKERFHMFVFHFIKIAIIITAAILCLYVRDMEVQAYSHEDFGSSSCYPVGGVM